MPPVRHKFHSAKTLDDLLSIFTDLMGTDTIYQSLDGMPIVVYTERKKDIPPLDLDCIFAYNGATTHYRVIKDGQLLDPYDNYQKINSHGLCQLFAYYIYNEYDLFEPVGRARGQIALGIYARNMMKVIETIESLLTSEVLYIIKNELPDVCKENQFKSMTFDALMRGLKSFKQEDYEQFVLES